MPTVESAILIQADVEHVYAIAREVERFPDFMPDVRSVRVLECSDEGRRTVVEWVGLIPEFKQTVKWVEEDLWGDAEHTCHFRLVRGDFKEYSGLWRFTAADGSEGPGQGAGAEHGGGAPWPRSGQRRGPGPGRGDARGDALGVPTPPVTRFESRVSYEYDIPLIGPLIKGVIRKKMQENVDHLLQAIKARAESG
jgi:ribosome-associated toxin RatA of RatAB toxin-antitoxin module